MLVKIKERSQWHSSRTLIITGQSKDCLIEKEQKSMATESAQINSEHGHDVLIVFWSG